MEVPDEHISVVVRLRPPRAQKRALGVKVSTDGKEVEVANKTHSKAKDSIDNTAVGHLFAFDGVFRDASQETVYKRCVEDLTEACLDGQSCACLVYGQTGAGKTFTMTGGSTDESRGIMPRAIAQLLTAARDRGSFGQDGPRHLILRMSYLEIYRDSLTDLLAGAPTSTTAPAPAANDIADADSIASDDDDTDGCTGESAGAVTARKQQQQQQQRLRVMEDRSGRVFVRGLQTPIIESEEQALRLLELGDAARAVAEHKLNVVSSRSHAVLTLYVQQDLPLSRLPAGVHHSSSSSSSAGMVTVLSKLHLVDLAGSERVKVTGSEGATLREAQYINKSLGLLEQVVLALTGSSSSSSSSTDSSGSVSGGGDDGVAAAAAATTTNTAMPHVAFGSHSSVSSSRSVKALIRDGSIKIKAEAVSLGWTDLPVTRASTSNGNSSEPPSDPHHAEALKPPPPSYQQQHIPYRRSKLTFLLKDALGGTCRTRLIAAVWPEAEHVAETLSTLRFASRMRNVAVRPVYTLANDDDGSRGGLLEGGVDGGAAGGLNAREARRMRERYEAELAEVRRQLAEARAVSAENSSSSGVSAFLPASGPVNPSEAINSLSPSQRAAVVSSLAQFNSDSPQFLAALSGFSVAQSYFALLLMRQRLKAAGASGSGLTTVADSGAGQPLSEHTGSGGAQSDETVPVADSSAVQSQPSIIAPATIAPVTPFSALAASQTSAAVPLLPAVDRSALDRAIDAAQSRAAAYDKWAAEGGEGHSLVQEAARAKQALLEKKRAYAAQAAAARSSKEALDRIAQQILALKQLPTEARPVNRSDSSSAEQLAASYVAAKTEHKRLLAEAQETRADIDHLQRGADTIAVEIKAAFDAFFSQLPAHGSK